MNEPKFYFTPMITVAFPFVNRIASRQVHQFNIPKVKHIIGDLLQLLNGFILKYCKKYVLIVFLFGCAYANRFEISVRNDSVFNVEYLIIAPDSFSIQALQLAEYRSSENLICNIVSIDSINDLGTFSTLDSTLKDYIKYIWYNNSTELQYTILLGDWDIIPPHSEHVSFTNSDWYFDNWYTNDLDSTAQNSYESSFSIGRIPAESSNQLQWYINRLIQYENQIQILPWQHRVIGIAGDIYYSNCLFDNITLNLGMIAQNEGLDFTFISTCEESEYYEPNQSTVFSTFTLGSILTLYTDYTSNEQWGNDSLFTFDNVNDLDFWHYSSILLSSGSSQYGFRDTLSSIAKKMCVETVEGPIAIFSSANPLTVHTNQIFNTDLLTNILSGDRTRIGDSFVETVNEFPSLGIRSFQLFGDPALTPQIIKNESQVNEPFTFELTINAQPPFISIFPKEEWIYLEIPLSHYPSVFIDSLEQVSINQVSIFPYFVSDSIQIGSIILDDFVIGDSYYEDFEDGFIEWEIHSEGNELNLNLTSETPFESGNALELEFRNSDSDTLVSSATITFDLPIITTLTDTIGFWIKRRSVSLDFEPTETVSPNNYKLYRPYPNPFNPLLSIVFYIPQHSNVKISVFDILGREVATIVNDNLPIGMYKREWNGNLLASGIYFVIMRSNDYFHAEKVLLLK
jgi:hypothetical protein